MNIQSVKDDDIYQLCMHAICNPIIFCLYIFIFAHGSLGNKSSEIFGFETFSYVSTNTYSINLIPFIIFSILIYFIVLLIELYASYLFRCLCFKKNINLKNT